ncbi:gram-negative porin family protein [Delftia acidovorans]|uniref:porin n=1 Tax=Delftia acidovorans TaxID=80866 RepID=UPI000504DEB7|nr:porin [Delftia acidovorans]KFJ12763.1 gram-negative porin family protein [Delftia acidovorans]QQB53680.1 porin [Delftia acidovorans]
MTNSFVKKAMAAALLGGSASLASEKSSVQIYGVVDAGVRATTNQGKTQMVGGGMSQSRWGVNVKEDMGEGLTAIANLESRFLMDTGNSAALNYFQQSWVGLHSKDLGQITMGRQFNVLIDVFASTYASFPYSPFMEVYKPEIGLAMGTRANNMVKYTANLGAWRASLQYTFDEENTIAKKGEAVEVTGGLAIKTTGGYIRYQNQGVAVGGAYLNTKLPGSTEFDAFTIGASYRSGPWYFSTGYALNERKNSLAGKDARLIGAYWGSEVNGGFQSGDSRKRQLLQMGIGYQMTPQLNLGMHLYQAKQSGSFSGDFNNKANFIIAVADYVFSKRTDAYIGVDYTHISDGTGSYIEKTMAEDLVRNRAGITIGLRHRF